MVFSIRGVCVLVIAVMCTGWGCNCGSKSTNGGDGGAGDGSLVIYLPDGAVVGSDGGVVTVIDNTHCPGCPVFPPLKGGPPACTGTGAQPTIVYPPNGVLLPPNMNVIEVQFTPGAGNSLFEVDFENSITDVRVETTCSAITNTQGVATGGCGYALDQNIWNDLAQNNRGGNPVVVTVRASPQNLSCVGVSSSVSITFAEEDINGGLYYWESATYNGKAGATGGIFRYDFGSRAPTATPFLTPSSFNNGRCVGCHSLSRDGQRMTYGTDDADSDDEYGDLTGNVMDVGALMTLSQFGPGFQTFSNDHSMFLASDGLQQNTPPALNVYNGNTGQAAGQAPSGQQATHPDWSPDNSSVVFVWGNFMFDAHFGDDHFTSGSLYTMSFSGGTWGTPKALLQQQGTDNNYYPSYSPDGQFVIFNKASKTDPSGGVDAYNNPDARIFVIPAAGGTPVELAKLDQAPGLANSWPRWSPFVQTYQGKRLLWVTFSSTRDYGLRVQNNQTGFVQCYPPDTPENPCSTGFNCHCVPLGCYSPNYTSCNGPFNCPTCKQPQIWMGAVFVESSELGMGVDTSFSAFWLPFQDDTSHNHIAQWTQTVVLGPDAGTPPSDAGPLL
jgi:hypothetical protein